MKKVNRKSMRAMYEARDKVRKDIREGKMTKQQAKNKNKGKR